MLKYLEKSTKPVVDNKRVSGMDVYTKTCQDVCPDEKKKQRLGSIEMDRKAMWGLLKMYHVLH